MRVVLKKKRAASVLENVGAQNGCRQNGTEAEGAKELQLKGMNIADDAAAGGMLPEVDALAHRVFLDVGQDIEEDEEAAAG